MIRLGKLAPVAVLALAACGYSTYYPHTVDFPDDTGVPEQVPCGFAGPTAVQLTLTSSIAVQQLVYEVDPASCFEQFRYELLPGGSAEFGTLSGVTWVSRGITGEVLGYFTVPDGGTAWTEAVP